MAFWLVIVAVLVAVFVLSGSRKSPPALQRIQFEIPSAGDVGAGAVAPQISPDGRAIAFVSPPPTGGASLIWVRPLDTLDARSLPGTENANSLFWSTDSKQIGFAALGTIKRVSLGGRRAAAALRARQFCGRHLVGVRATSCSRRTSPAEIVSCASVTPAARQSKCRQHDGVIKARLWPSWLPDGKHFLYITGSATESRAAYVGSVDGGASVRLMQTDGSVMYGPPGFIVFTRSGAMFAQPFDAASLALSGEPVKLADDVLVNMVTGRAGFSVSGNGVLAYRRASAADALTELAWMDRSGKAVARVGAPRSYYQIRLSPDGKRVAVSELDQASQNYRLSVLDLGNGVASALGSGGALENDPVWGPDSQTIGFEAIREKPGRQIYTQRVGSSSPTLVFESADDPKWVDDWSADGKFLLFHLPKPSKLFALPLAEPRTPIKLLDTTEIIEGAHFSPDGKWVAYLVTEAGEYQVWIASFPTFDRRRRVSPEGGGQAIWRSDGRELFYLTPTGKLMVVAVNAPAGSADVDVAAPVELFQSPFTSPTLSIDQYAVSRDGQRFLFIQPRAASGTRPPMVVVVNWAEGLKSTRN